MQDVEQQQETEQKVELLMQQRERLSISIHGTTSFRTRVEAVYPEVKETSKDGTITYLKDGTEIHWVVNPNQDGVYQQKLDEALSKQADAAADDKIDLFLSETDYVFKYTDKDADVAMPLKDLGIDCDKEFADQYRFHKKNSF